MLNLLKDRKVIFFEVGSTLERPSSGAWMFTGRLRRAASSSWALSASFCCSLNSVEK